jgi:hypothetical protein
VRSPLARVRKSLARQPPERRDADLDLDGDSPLIHSNAMARGATVLLIALAGCNAVLGIEVLPTGDTLVPVKYAEPACEACHAAQCAAEKTACDSDAACRPLHACVAKCALNDAACRTTCESSSPFARQGDRFIALDRCVRRGCTETCLGTSGLGAASGPGCACLDASCPSETLGCIRSGLDGAGPGNCERVFGCLDSKEHTPDTVTGCLADFPLGDTEVTALRACWTNASCPECRIQPNDFSCARKYRWSVPVKSSVQVTMHVTKVDGTQTPIRDATVFACNVGKCGACTIDDALAKGTTNENGDARFTLPIGITGFGGCMMVQADGYVTNVISFGAPLVRDARVPMFLIDSTTLGGLAFLLKTTPNPDRGHLIVLADDCFAQLSAGVTADIAPRDEQTVSGYYVGATSLDPKATATGRNGTEVFVNVPPGVLTLTSHTATSPEVTSGLVVRQGMLTVQILYPPVSD